MFFHWLISHCTKQVNSKDQGSIQSSITPDPGQHMGKWQNQKKISHTRGPRGQPFLSNSFHLLSYDYDFILIFTPEQGVKIRMNKSMIIIIIVTLSDVTFGV